MDSKIAAFIDFENIVIGAEKAQLGPFKISVIIERLKDKGDIIVKKAYSDWSKYEKYKQSIHENGIDLIELPSNNILTGKNSCDIKMVIDAIELAFTRHYIDTFALITGDSDFSFLALKLKELDKRVIGIGVESSTHPQLIRCCDEFIFYDQLINLSTSEDYEHMDVFTLLKEAIYALQREDKENIYSSMIKETILKKLPSFDEQNYGFKSFEKFLLESQRRGIIKVIREGANRNLQVELTEDSDSEDRKSHKFDSTQAYELIVKAILNQNMDKYVMHPAATIREEMLKFCPSFNEKKYGFKSFRHLLECAQARRVVRLERDPGTGSIYLVGISDDHEQIIKKKISTLGLPGKIEAKTDREREDALKHRSKKSGHQEANSLSYSRFLKGLGFTVLPPEQRKRLIYILFDMYKSDLKKGANFKTMTRKLEETNGLDGISRREIGAFISSLSQSGCFVGKNGNCSRSTSYPVWLKISPYEAIKRLNKFILWNATRLNSNLDDRESLLNLIFGSDAQPRELEALIRELEREKKLTKVYKDKKESFQRTGKNFI